jgi:hypothetical protein
MENPIFETEDIIEIVAELFELYDFEVVFHRGIKRVYNHEQKRIYYTYSSDEYAAMLGFAHEIMHHKQNTEGRLMTGKDFEIYRENADKTEKNPRNKALHQAFPVEIEADAFSHLFIDKLFEFMFNIGLLSQYKYKSRLKMAKAYLSIEQYGNIEPASLKQYNEMRNEWYKRFAKAYGEQITELIASRYSTPEKERTYKIKIKHTR